MTNPSNELEDWEIGPETCVGGIDANDAPSQAWHIPADNWLTLARLSYGVKQKAHKADKLDVFDTTDYVVFRAVLPRGLRSVRNDGAAHG